LPADGNDIETTGLGWVVFPEPEKVLRSTDKAFLLCDGHAFSTTAMPVVSPVPHFGEYQRLSIQHDKINFANPTVEIAFQSREASPVQKRFSKQFPFTSLGPHISFCCVKCIFFDYGRA